MFRTLLGVIRAGLVGACFVYFGVGGLVMSYVLLPLARRGLPDGPERVRRVHEVVAGGFVQFHALMRNLRCVHFDPREVSLALPDGPCVIVSNHPTLVDVTALSSVLRSVCTVVRSDLCDNVFIGRILRYSWHIDGGDAGAMSGAAVIQGALDRLAAGFRVLIFPEGTRSPPGGLRRFRRGAYEVACRANVPVALLFITCTPPTLMKGVPWYGLPKRTSRMRVELIEVLQPADFSGDARLLARHAKEMYRSRLDAWRAAHPDDAPIPPPTGAEGDDPE